MNARIHPASPQGRLILGILLGVSLAFSAQAGPPEHVDPALAPWFQSLQRPDIGSCCSVADGRVTESRVVGDHYEVLIDSRFPGVTEPSWQPVPPAAILKRVDNPTGATVAFWYMGQVRCVVLPAEI